MPSGSLTVIASVSALPTPELMGGWVSFVFVVMPSAVLW